MDSLFLSSHSSSQESRWTRLIAIIPLVIFAVEESGRLSHDSVVIMTRGSVLSLSKISFPFPVSKREQNHQGILGISDIRELPSYLSCVLPAKVATMLRHLSLTLLRSQEDEKYDP